MSSSFKTLVMFCALLGSATFLRAETATYIGADGGPWDSDGNWSGARIPTADDDVVIDGKWVQSAGSVTAKSILVKGSKGYLTVAGTTKTVGEQTGADKDSTEPAVMTVSGDVVLDGGLFSIGGRFQQRGFSAAIGGDLVITNGAKAYFYAGRTDELNPLLQAEAMAKLWAAANIVTIGGELKVGKSSYLVPENERLTGTPVFFKPRDFTLEAGGVVTSTARGWKRYKTTSFTAGHFPLNALSGFSYGGSDVNCNWYTYSFSGGNAYGKGSGHGGTAAANGDAGARQITDCDGGYTSVTAPFGKAYGYEAAPFLPGSASGVWNEQQVYAGGGSICIFASGKATVNGALESNGEYGGSTYSSSAGGSIWIAADSLSVGRTTTMRTTGGNSSYGCVGAGGRVALTAGASAADINAFAEGSVPEGFAVVDLYGCDATAWGGYYGSSRSGNGTVKIVYKKGGAVPVEITADPEEKGTVAPAYGLQLVNAAAVPEISCSSEYDYNALYHNCRRSSMSEYVTKDLDGNVVATPIAESTIPLRLVWQSGVEDVLHLRIRGSGSVTINGTAYAASQDIWFASGATLNLSAQAGDGQFVRWSGDLAGMTNAASSVTLTALPGMTVAAIFSDAIGETKNYVGEDGGYWDVDSNWDPSGIPLSCDRAVVASKKVRAEGVVAVDSLALEGGTLSIGGGVTSTTELELPSDVLPCDMGLWVAKDFVATGASAFALNTRRMTAPLLGAEIGGTLALSNTTTFAVYAPPYDGPLDGGKIPLTNAYDTTFVVKIGEDLSIGDSTKVYPENDRVTGTGVRFEVAGDVTLGASASISSSGRGWGWINYKTDVLGQDSRRRVTEGDYVSLCYGWGSDWTYGGAYGAGFTTTPKRMYGFQYAPCLSGSPSGSGSYNGFGVRGGGMVWIEAQGKMTLDGGIYANGVSQDSSRTGSSGGSVWLCAKKITGGSGLKIQAIGGGGGGASGAKNTGGTGGRISLAIGVGKEDLRSLAQGLEPEGLTYSTGVSVGTVSVAGGFDYMDPNTKISYYAAAGTMTTVIGETEEFALTMISVPANIVAEGISYVPVMVAKDETITRTAPQYGYDPSDVSDVRYVCQGWVVSNSTEEVASGNTRTAEFVSENGPFTLTWLWGDRAVRKRYAPNNEEWGEVRANGEETASTEVWAQDSSGLTLVPVAKEGCEFLFWTGEVPLGATKTNSLVISQTSPCTVMPVFRKIEAPQTRTWNGGTSAIGSWCDASKWEPSGNLPGFGDTVVIGTGYCLASNYIECANLVVSNAAILRVGQFVATANRAVSVTSDSVWSYPRTYNLGSLDVIVSGDLTLYNSAQLGMSARRGKIPSNIKVGGNLTLNGTSKLLLVGGLVDGTTTTYAEGGSRVDVTGTLAVRDTAVVYPESEYWKGGTPVFRVESLVLEEGAAFNADSHGYDRASTSDGCIPNAVAPGLGYTHEIGAGHGGRGGGSFHEDWRMSYGQPYGFPNSPVLPGSCKGDYSNDVSGSDGFRGGGLVRIHVRESAQIEGSITARGHSPSVSLIPWGSGSSGGGIWVTANHFTFGANAKLLVPGTSIGGGYGSAGAGGRIALGWRLKEAQIEAMARSSALPRGIKAKAVYEYEGFTAFWQEFGPNVPAVDVTGGVDSNKNKAGDGTFRFVDGRNVGMMLILK